MYLGMWFMTSKEMAEIAFLKFFVLPQSLFQSHVIFRIQERTGQFFFSIEILWLRVNIQRSMYEL